MTQYNPSTLSTGSVTIAGTRYAAGGYNKKGRHTKGASSVLSIEGNHQPASNKDTLLLPEGERTKDLRKIYTPTELRPVDVFGATAADTLVIDGKTYVIFTQVKYNMGVLDHYKAIGVRRDE